MSNAIQIALIGLLAGILGTSTGGALSLGVRRPSRRMIGALLAVSAGIMLTVVFSDLIPEAVRLGSLVTTAAGTAFGVGIMVLLDILLPAPPEPSGSHISKDRLVRAGILLGLGIGLHNLPEGLAIGAGYSASESIGAGIALVIGLHNIPEGMAMAGPMRGAGLSARPILTWTAMAGAPMAIGAYVGAVVGSVSPLFLSGALGLAAGAMLYIIFKELLPDATRLASHVPTAIATAGGVALGFVILEIVHLIQAA